MRRAVGIAALFLALAAVPAGASTFIALGDAELVAQSDAVVVGEILETYSYWNDAKTMIFTEAVVHVQRLIAGDAPALVNVRTPGGIVADYKVEAHGFPTFERGERQLLFLHRAESGLLEVTGFQQGQFRVKRGGDGVDLAVPALGNVQLLTRTGVPAPRPETVRLEDLVRTIQTIAPRVERGPMVK